MHVCKNSDENSIFKLRICTFISINCLLQSNRFQVVFEAHGPSSVKNLIMLVLRAYKFSYFSIIPAYENGSESDKVQDDVIVSK